MTGHVEATIGEAARATGCKVQTIRYYEQIGLLQPAARSAGNHRRYQRTHLERLAFIRRARALGFPLESVRALLELADQPDRSCASVDAVAREHSAIIAERIACLKKLKQELDRVVQECAGGRTADCRIIQMLASDDAAMTDEMWQQSE